MQLGRVLFRGGGAHGGTPGRAGADCAHERPDHDPGPARAVLDPGPVSARRRSGAVAMPFGLATNAGALEPWERLASIGLGAGVSAGALWWLARNPATQVQLDLTQRRLRLVRIGLSGRLVRQFSFDDLASAEVEQGTDDEGGLIWRPAVRLRSGEKVLLSELWSHDRAEVEEGRAVVVQACGL
jgi:hypothetical protein